MQIFDYVKNVLQYEYMVRLRKIVICNSTFTKWFLIFRLYLWRCDEAIESTFRINRKKLLTTTNYLLYTTGSKRKCSVWDMIGFADFEYAYFHQIISTKLNDQKDYWEFTWSKEIKIKRNFFFSHKQVLYCI